MHHQKHHHYRAALFLHICSKCAVKPDKTCVVIIVITTCPVSKQGLAAQGGSPSNPATLPGVACCRQPISLLALAIGSAPWCGRPSPLGRDLCITLAVLLACGKPLQNITCVQGLVGHVADIIRVWGWAWVMLQRGLVCVIKTSFQKTSQPMKHCFLEGVGGK